MNGVEPALDQLVEAIRAVGDPSDVVSRMTQLVMLQTDVAIWSAEEREAADADEGAEEFLARLGELVLAVMGEVGREWAESHPGGDAGSLSDADNPSVTEAREGLFISVRAAIEGDEPRPAALIDGLRREAVRQSEGLKTHEAVVLSTAADLLQVATDN